MLQVACVLPKCCICCSDYTRMLQVYVPNDSKCFSCFRRMLQVFYLDVAYVLVAIHICCKPMFQMFHLFQTYFAAMLHVASAFISRRGSRAQAGAVPTCAGGPQVHA
jgi:hypothetical protein